MASSYSITLSDGSTLGTVLPLESLGSTNKSVPRQIIDVNFDAASPSITLADDVTARFVNGFQFSITGGSAYDGNYVVTGTPTTAVLADGKTVTRIPLATPLVNAGYTIFDVVTGGTGNWVISGPLNGNVLFYPGSTFNVTGNSNGGANTTYTVTSATTKQTFPIASVVTGVSGKFVITGDFTQYIRVGATFSVHNTGYDQLYTIASKALVTGNTEITVTGTVPAGTVGGGTTYLSLTLPVTVIVTGAIIGGAGADGLAHPAAPVLYPFTNLATQITWTPSVPHNYLFTFRVAGDQTAKFLPNFPFTLFNASYNGNDYTQVLYVSSPAPTYNITSDYTEITAVITDQTLVTPVITTKDTHGHQDINFTSVTGGGATGLTNDATVYTATITVDGVAKPITVTGSAAQTFTTLINEINTDLGSSATAVLDSANHIIRVISATYGTSSTVAIVDGTLLAALTNFSSIIAAIPGAFNTKLIFTVPGIPYGYVKYTRHQSVSSLKVLGPGCPTYNDTLTWGYSFQENQLHTLENFQNTLPPVAPLNGQLWYDPSVPVINSFRSSAQRTVTAVTTGLNGIFTVAGNHTAEFTASTVFYYYDNFNVGAATASYTVSSSALVSGNTEITVTGTIPAGASTANSDGSFGIVYVKTAWNSMVSTNWPVQSYIDMNNYKIVRIADATTTYPYVPSTTGLGNNDQEVVNLRVADTLYIAKTGGSSASAAVRSGTMTGSLNMNGVSPGGASAIGINVNSAPITMYGTSDLNFDVGGSGGINIDGSGSIVIATGGITLNGATGSGNIHIAGTGNLTIDTGGITLNGATGAGNIHIAGTGNITVDTGNVTVTTGNVTVGSGTNKVVTQNNVGSFPTITFTTSTTANGVINLGTNKIINASDPTAATDVANKHYVDSLANGIIWLQPVKDPNLFDDSLTAPPTIPPGDTLIPYHKTYIVATGGSGAWTGLDGHAVVYDPNTSAWVDILGRVVQAGDRFGVFCEPDDNDPLAALPGGGLVGKAGKIVTIASVGPIVYTDYTPAEPEAFSVTGANPTINNLTNSYDRSPHFGHSYTFRGTWGTGTFGTDYKWIEFSGPQMLVDGAGLRYTGNILNVGAGFGITVNADTVQVNQTDLDTVYVTLATTQNITGAKTFKNTFIVAADGTNTNLTINTGGLTYTGTSVSGGSAYAVSVTAGAHTAGAGGAITATGGTGSTLGGDITLTTGSAPPTLVTPATAGYQIVNVGGAKVGTDPTGLAADTAGYQVVDVGGAKIGTDPSGLANDTTTYTASISVDGTPHAISIVGSASQTYADVINEINTDLGASATAALVGGNIRVTSATTGTSSTVAITDTNLFSSLTGYVQILTAVGGTSTTYTASISVDGTPHAISVIGNNAQTFTTLLSEINTDLGASATATLSGGNIKVTSATTGVTSTVAITDTDLFNSLTGYVAILTAVPGTDAVYSYESNGLLSLTAGNTSLKLDPHGVWKVNNAAPATANQAIVSNATAPTTGIPSWQSIAHRVAAAPAASTDPGNPGDWFADDSFFYVYGATGWRRVGTSSF